jgi:hypothetical protein
MTAIVKTSERRDMRVPLAPGGHYSEVGFPSSPPVLSSRVGREFRGQAALQCLKGPFGSGADLLDRHMQQV